jgi:hypothetical protein
VVLVANDYGPLIAILAMELLAAPVKSALNEMILNGRLKRYVIRIEQRAFAGAFVRVVPSAAY